MLSIVLLGIAVFGIDNSNLQATPLSLDAELLWTVGASEDDVLFGRIADVEITETGCVWILDSQLYKITQLDQSGALANQFGVFGEGPEDLNRPVDIAIQPDGSIAVFESQPPGVKIFKPTGAFDHYLSFASQLPPNSTLVRAAAMEDGIAISGNTSTFTDSGMLRRDWLCTLVPPYSSAVELMSSEVAIDTKAPIIDERLQRSFVTRWAASSTASIAVVPEFEVPEVLLLGPEQHSLSLDTLPIRRTRQEVDKIRRVFTESSGRGGPLVQVTVAAVHEAVPKVFYSGDGTFWAWLGLPYAWKRSPNCLGAFAVFNPQGAKVEIIELQGPQNVHGEQFAFGKEGVVVVRGIAAQASAGQYLNAIEAREDEEATIVVEYYKLGGPRQR